MPNSELHVAISGTDTLSPALQRVSATLERSRIALNASGAVADIYGEKLLKLHQQYATGEIDAIKYDRALNALDRDFKRATESVAKYSNNTAAAAGATNQMTGAATRTTAALGQSAEQATRGYTRLAFGVQSMSAALNNGKVSAQGMIGGLLGIGLGSGPFLAITAGLSVVANLLLNIKDNADDAGEGIGKYARLALAMRGINPAQTAEMLSAEIANAQRQLSEQRPLHRGENPLWGQDRHILQGDARRQREEDLANMRVLQVLNQNPQRQPKDDHPDRRPLEVRLKAGNDTSTKDKWEATGKVEADHRLTGPVADMLRRPDLNEGRGKRKDLPTADSFGALMGAMSKTDGAVEGMNKVRDAIGEVDEKLRNVVGPIEKFAEAMSLGIGAAIDTAISGGHVFQAFTHEVLTALSREAKGKAIFEAAEGFAALGKGLLFGDPKAIASAGAHFKAAALYGGAAIATGALASSPALGGGRRDQSPALAGAGGTSTDNNAPRQAVINQYVTPLRAFPATRSAPQVPATVVVTAPAAQAPQQINQPVTVHLQLVTEAGRELSRHIVEMNARQERLGAPAVARIPLQAVVLGGPVVRV